VDETSEKEQIINGLFVVADKPLALTRAISFFVQSEFFTPLGVSLLLISEAIGM